ncbi:MAG: hypothetical protein D6714_00160, partial [Bacteroidetes bacterium]
KSRRDGTFVENHSRTFSSSVRSDTFFFDETKARKNPKNAGIRSRRLARRRGYFFPNKKKATPKPE